MSEFGIEALTDDDRAYAGSRYRDVVDALFANPYQRVWGGAGEPPLPIYEVTLGRLIRGAIVKASARTLDSGADLRWGPDRKGFRRLVHPNGVCLLGQWRITEPTAYSGYFGAGSEALVVARYSTCCTRTERGEVRSLALVGKLYPTLDPDHTAPLRTANFITQEDIGGASTAFVNDAELRNAPDTTVSRRGAGAPLLLLVAASFARVDQQVSLRQVYPIAELGKPAGQPTRAPEFMRLMMAPGQPRIPGERLDFRDEIMAQIFDRGDPAPKRSLTFAIEVTDQGQTSGPGVRLRRTFQNWRPIGALTFDHGVMSYNGDSVVHFRHPTWRLDRNDPATATRIDGRKVH
jgi:hypothetical protein